MKISANPRFCLLMTLIITSISAASSIAKDADRMICGQNFIHTESHGEIPEGGLTRNPDWGTRTDRLAAVTFNPGPTLSANADALAAFNRAIDTWISWFEDPVTIIIDADLALLGAGVLGQAQSRIFTYPYNTVRGWMVSDANPTDEPICSSLPTLAQYNMIMPAGFTFNDEEMSATKANFRCLGYDMSFDDPNADVTITFNSDMLGDFDFDRSNGINASQYDFEGIILHEIGHALGFSSEVTGIDWLIDQMLTGEVNPRPLDLFRLEPGDGAADFVNSDRILAPAYPPGGPNTPTQVTYTGSEDLQMSTGRFAGDERQPSHWKDNFLTGNYLGLMDPTLGRGFQVKPQANDIISLGLIGWDIGQGPCLGIPYGDCNGDFLTLTSADLVYMQRYLQHNANHFGNLCSYELNHYDNPFFPCEPTFGDYLFYLLYFTTTLTIGDLNPECQYTTFPERYGLNILMPGNVDLSSSFSETYTIQLENVNVIPLYIWSLTVPVHFPYTGGTGSAVYSFTNIQDYGVWSVIDPNNPSGKPAISLIGPQPVLVPALTTIDLFDVDYNWTYTSGSPIMNAEFFTESPGCVPVASISASPKASVSRDRQTWLIEVRLGSEIVSHSCDCVPGECDGADPINILDIVYLINYVYKSGPEPTPHALCSGDPDKDCTINILDIVYLINYIYKSGPDPATCQEWVAECGPVHK